jgi:hypothetical protein
VTAVLLVPDGLAGVWPGPARPWPLVAVTDPADGAPDAADTTEGADASVTMVVIRVGTVSAGRPSPVLDRHLRAGGAAPRPWRMAADVLVAPGGPERAAGLARRHPGALVTAAHSGSDCWVLLGTGTRTPLRLRKRGAPSGAAAPPGDLPWPVWASLVHAWLVAGVSPRTLASSSARPVPVPLGPWGATRGQTVLLRAGH